MNCKICEDKISKEEKYYKCRVSGAIICEACVNDVSDAKAFLNAGIIQKWFR